MSDQQELLSRLKQYARGRDLHVTWAEVRSQHSDQYNELLDHEKRKVRVEFEAWITRERVQRRKAA